ncbi:putative exostosin [Helianthus annuus]|nr:putative exostosin [Helianthus annuus]KAJ0782755.1 putative exostosin [Helianthus annuus]
MKMKDDFGRRLQPFTVSFFRLRLNIFLQPLTTTPIRPPTKVKGDIQLLNVHGCSICALTSAIRAPTGLGQCMSAVEYRAILKYRLMVPLFPVDDPCPVCRKSCLDTFGEHAIHCKELPGFKYRHDLVRHVLYDVLKRAGISAKKEAPMNFLTDPLEGRSTLRPADILVFGWEGGKHACVDLTGVSPLVGLRDHGFVAGQAITKAEAAKVAKHEKACIENQHVFTPFAFDTFGALAPDAVRFLKRVQQVVSSNTAHVKGQNFVFSRVGFAIQKGVAAQLVARLPAISL